MFTGIVEELGRVESFRDGRLRIGAETVLDDLAVSDSIAVNGACLTCVALGPGRFEVDVVPETLRRTNLGSLAPGAVVNLERSLAAGARMGGHIVQGHVDGTGVVASITQDGDAVVIEINAPEGLTRYVVEKGFIALDGISLTVVKAPSSSFTISVIPYTLRNTNLRSRRVGEAVNLEVDILAKYVEKLLPAHGQSSPGA